MSSANRWSRSSKRMVSVRAARHAAIAHPTVTGTAER